MVRPLPPASGVNHESATFPGLVRKLTLLNRPQRRQVPDALHPAAFTSTCRTSTPTTSASRPGDRAFVAWRRATCAITCAITWVGAGRWMVNGHRPQDTCVVLLSGSSTDNADCANNQRQRRCGVVALTRVCCSHAPKQLIICLKAAHFLRGYEKFRTSR
jgi:hypothetical protein